MKNCVRQDEVAQTVQAGQWPQGCTDELREHVNGCRLCTEHVRLMTAFGLARSTAMQMATPQTAGLIWWKAQLRRRQQAMEKLERPGLAISTATMTASVVVLIAVLLTVAKRVQWSRVLALFSPAGWSVWMTAAVAAALCGFAVVAVVVGLGLSEERG